MKAGKSREPEELKKIQKLEKRYISWLSELGRHDHVDMNVTVHSISKDLQGEVMDEGEYQVLNTDTIHHFVGVVIDFRVRESNKPMLATSARCERNN
ncbi:MAG: hypothetical protein ACQEQ2_11150 [Pseudomonadota bacterium]